MHGIHASRRSVVAMESDSCHRSDLLTATCSPLRRCGPRSGLNGTQQGPARGGQSPGASEHRHRADALGLQLAGNGLSCAQRHQAGLEHRPTATADVDRDARLRGSLEITRIDVHKHLADRAAESAGGHGWMARNTDPAPRRSSCARAVAQEQRLASALAWLWR